MLIAPANDGDLSFSSYIEGAPVQSNEAFSCSWLAGEALHAIRRGGTIRSISDLNTIIEPALVNFGFSSFAGIRLPHNGEADDLQLMFGKGLERWHRHYSEMRYFRSDPMCDECRRSVEPFYWSDLSKNRELSNVARQMLNDARSFGIEDAFVAPISKDSEAIFIVLFGGKVAYPPSPEIRAATHMLAAYYGVTGYKIYNPPEPGLHLAQLTFRQRQCLSWVRAGESSTDIATILRITPGVVDEHIANACRRLGVGTRMQAVLTASDLGYLDH